MALYPAQPEDPRPQTHALRARQDIKEGPSPCRMGQEAPTPEQAQDIFSKGSHFYSAPDSAAWDCGHRVPWLPEAVPPEPASPAGSCRVCPHGQGWKGLGDPCRGDWRPPQCVKEESEVLRGVGCALSHQLLSRGICFIRS